MANYFPTGVWWFEAILFGGAILFWGLLGSAYPGPNGIPVEEGPGFGGLASAAGGAALAGVGAWLRRRPGHPESAAATTPAHQRSVEFSRGGAAAVGPRWYRRMLATGILFASAGLAAGVAILSAAPGTTAYTELGILAFALALAGIVVGAAGYSTRER